MRNTKHELLLYVKKQKARTNVCMEFLLFHLEAFIDENDDKNEKFYFPGLCSHLKVGTIQNNTYILHSSGLDLLWCCDDERERGPADFVEWDLCGKVTVSSLTRLKF